MKRTMQRSRKKIQKPRDCYFCKEEKEPDYKDSETIRRFTTERGKTIGKMYNGLCQSHQGKLSKAVKRARFIAFLPFIVRPT